jgi:hypothetical protein
MKIERIHERILTIVVVVGGLLFALYCGKLAGTGNFKNLGILFELLGMVAVCMALRDKVWVFIPFFWPLTGKIPITEIPFGLRDWAVLLTFGSFVVLSMLKMFRHKPRFELVDLFIGLSLLNLVTVFVRNPVGVDWMNSQLVGGRPYFDIFIAFLAYFVLARSPITLPILRRLPVIAVLGTVLVAIGGLIALLSPALGDYLGMFYSAFAPNPNAVETGEDEIGRMAPLAFGGLALALVLTSRFDPITLLSPRHPLRLLGMVLALSAIMLSGFRSFLFAALVYVAMACYFRKKWRDLFLLGAVGIFLVAILALGNNRLFQLPLSAQRALSFLPGKWDYVAVADAKGSTEWRWEIWRMALFEEGWIRNKWLGDGFGFTKYQLHIMNSRAGYMGGAGQQEAYLVTGNYHSGPISTIRYAGAVGLVLFVPLMALMVVRCSRLIKRSYGTPYFTMALFIGLPVIYLPFPWVFVAGAFNNGMIDLMYAAGFVKLLERGLAEYESATPGMAASKEPLEAATMGLPERPSRPAPVVHA